MSSFSLAKELRKFGDITGTPTIFLDKAGQISDNIKINIQGIYDFTKKEEIYSQTENCLPKLFIKNLDSEQIWQQIEIQNKNVLDNCINNISVLLGANKLLFNLIKENFEKKTNNTSESEDISENDSDDYVESKERNYSVNDNNKIYSAVEEPNSDECINRSRNTHNLVVDDHFFKLSEMEIFLSAEERKLADPNSGDYSDSTENDGEGNVNLFQDKFEAIMEHDDEAKMARFKDYFVSKDESKLSTKMLLRKNYEEDPSDVLKSNLELRQERLKIKIDKLEDYAISQKPWQLKGEITAEYRPQNSLLTDVVGFDLTSRPAPVITEQTSLQLEDIIRQRIQHKVFDSVERKNKPTETPLEYKKRLVLDQEKSKQSLAQIYEKEYFQRQAVHDPENADIHDQEPQLHKDIKILITNLFTKLDSVSNFHFSSKPTVPQLKVVSHLPAISLEEVAPIAASAAALLAPEDIKNKPNGSIIGKGERTSFHKKGERRKKKLQQKMHNQLKLKKENVKKSVLNSKSKT